MNAPNEMLTTACRYQGQLFVKSLESCTCSSAVFIRRFMNSAVCDHLDRTLPWGSPPSHDEVFRDLEEDYGPSNYGSIRYTEEELYWMGYLLRFWSLTRDVSSKSIYKIVGGRELAGLYPIYHGLDPDVAVERILESRGIALEEDSISRGVRELRHIRDTCTFEYAVMRLSDLQDNNNMTNPKQRL